MSNRTGSAQLVPDWERVFNPSRVKVVGVCCPISDGMPISHTRTSIPNDELPRLGDATYPQSSSISRRSRLFGSGNPDHTALAQTVDSSPTNF